MDIGDIIGASGKLFRTKSGEPTLEVENFTLLAKSLQPLPEKWHGLSDIDKRYRQRYLDLIANTETKEIFQMRSQVIAAIRDFDLSVRAGECIGIAGPNGAGKSTLLELAGGVYEPDSGTL